MIIHFGTLKEIVELGRVVGHGLDPLCAQSPLASIVSCATNEMTQQIEHTTCEVCCLMLIDALAGQTKAIAATLAGLRKMRVDVPVCSCMVVHATRCPAGGQRRIVVE